MLPRNVALELLNLTVCLLRRYFWCLNLSNRSHKPLRGEVGFLKCLKIYSRDLQRLGYDFLKRAEL